MWFTKLIPLLFLVIRTGSSERIPLRILTELDSSIDSLDESQRDLIEGSLLPSVLRWVEDNIRVDPQPRVKLLIDRSCTNDMTIKGSGFNKCIQGCVSNQQCGSHIIPAAHLGACTKMVGGVTAAAGEGVDEGFILYVSAGECDGSDPGNEAVQGKFCHSSPSKDFGRPTHGYMKFCTQELDNDVSKYEELVHKTLQRMLHILAFDKKLLGRFKDGSGRAHSDTMSEISRDYDVAVEGEGSVISKLLDYIVLPTVKEELQSHFNCDSIPGAQLESEDTVSGGDYIYFEKLFFGNELMTAGLQGRGVVSRLTRAVLQDCGWYSLSNDFSEPLVWGKGAGCGFALKFCHEQLSFNEYSPEEVAPFCVEPGKSKCAADHRGYGTCNIGQVSDAVPNEYRNFDEGYPYYVEGETTVGADVFADRCPYHQHDVMCTDITQQPQLDSFGEEYTGFSRCFDYVGNWTSTVQNAHQQSSGCYPIECGTDSYTVRVSKNTYTCTSGATIQVQNILINIPFEGTLLCPDYDIVCAGQVECTKDCHGNGKCVAGSEGEEDQCVCYPGYHGDNCDLTFGVDYCSATPCQSGSTCFNEDAGSFRCECKEDKTGVLCHISSSSCTPTSCLNNGRCEDRDGDVFCVCPPGFTGDKCEESLTACPEEENPCQNGAECFVDAESENGVKCACPFSYEGVYCESVKNCDIFGPLACQNDGSCIIGDDSYCDCPDNFMGHFCQIEICSENTCNGNGHCEEDLAAETVICSCDEGFSGERCENEEIDTPSQLDQCVLLNRCVVEGEVRVCNDGWTGRDCMSVDHCHDDPCEAANTARCTNYEKGFECECYSGYSGTLCTETDTFPTDPTTETPEETTTAPVDHCEPNPCLNGATCVSNAVTYFCRCTEEFTGSNCETPRGVCYKLPCKNGGICAQGQEPSDFSCSCPDEWTGPTCEEAVDPCELLDCINGGECIKLGDTASCSCPMGYEGTRCDDKANHCHSEPCAKDRGTCEYHPEHHNFTCHCKLGFMGPTCAEEMENSCELVSRCEHGTACVGSHDDYYCDCPEGLEGEFCEINPNDCVGNPCQRILFSRCQDLINGYECNCMPGFERRSNQCGDINECKNNPCLNGICINLPGKYRCMCRAGWTGTNCDIDKDECEAHGHKCLNGAQCVDLIADFRCDCVNHYTGQYCETAPPPCKLEPCQNGATCTDVDETNYRCNCPAGFEGDQCEVNIDECASNPCVNGTCVDGIADYTCECDVAYEGKNCDIYVGQCGVQPCANGAECVDLSATEFECICPEFYTGTLCDENIDDCAGDPCANGGTCNDGLGTFTCDCTDQWTGETCEEDVNECEVTPGICQNGGSCENLQGGFNCDCKDGFEGDLCETNTDDCVDHQCTNGGVCVDDIAGYNCQCPENYKGARCEIEVQFCKPDSCLNNGTCSVVDNVIQCDCSETGFEGGQCETEIDECVSQNVTCLHEGTCVDDILGYHCECHCAFTGVHCEEEVDFCANSTCSENTYMCISLVNSCNFQCQCQEGWDGTLCENDIDECADNPCIHGNCTDGIAEYTCSCDEGYRGDNCEEPLDKCAAEPCKNGAACETVVDGEERNFKCTCTPHYYGDTCEEKHAPCYISPCGDNGLCQVEGENEICACDDGFTGTFCETNIDDCAEDPCKNGATCHDKIMDFECDCQPGYGGKTCEALRDPCTDTELCQNGAECSECVGEECERRYTCTCVPGFTGINCETNIDECEADPCVRGECVDLVNDYRCQCPVGYTDKNCETDIDECDARPCRNGQECIDQIGNYTCNCVGFTGRNCETDINECETGEVTCQNNGTCVNTHGSFSCDCPPGFGGKLCERTVLPCDLHGKKCFNMAICHNIDTTTQYQCNCTGGYSGEFCEIPSDACSEENNPCVRGTCLDEEGSARCVCDYTVSDGEFCEIELCQDDTCQNNGRCEDTDEGFECTCNLPWVGKRCESKASVLQFKPKSRASIPLGEVTEKEIRVRMGLKIKDMTSEQQVFEQQTSIGQLSMTIFDSMIQVTLEETRLELPIMDKFATVSVILVEDYLELMVGNQTEVSVFSESREVAPSGGMQFGVASNKKRETLSSYTGCLVDIGNIDIINMAEGEGFDECSDDDEEEVEIDNIEETLPPCQNGGIRVGPYCQCMDGYRGDLCEIEIRENCQSKDCPGDCRETSRGPQCVCSWPKEGELCTDLTIIPSFRADSSLVFEGDQYKKGEETVYEFDLEINPEYPRGFIAMFEGSNGYCSMYLDGTIFFDCVSSENEHSIEHSQKVSLDYWSLIRVSIIEDTMSISVDGTVELFSSSHIHDINLDGPITFGSIPETVNITGTGLKESSIPGFFGEIHPVTLNNKKAKLKESVGFNVVSAKSRDLTEDYTPACRKSPCGEENTCYERARGHGCLCEVSPSGSDCSGTPELLTFMGTDSYAVFNTKYGDSNEFKIRFMSGAEEGVLLYGASKYKENTVPQSLFYLALKDGSVHFGMYSQPDVFKSLSLELSGESWNTVTLTLQPQKAMLSVSGKNLNHLIRTKYDEVDLFAKNSVYLGGVKDFTGLEHVNENFGANVPLTSFIGQVSQFELNQASLMSSIKSLVKVSADGSPAPCGISPCSSGACSGDGTCRCDNDLRSGDLCENTISFEPMQITEGYVAYHKHFDVGKSLVVKFSSPLIGTESDAEILRINTRFVENKEKSLVLKLSDFAFTTGSTKTLVLDRKMNHILITNGDEVINKNFSSEVRLDDEIFIGRGESNFTGKIFVVEMDGEKLVPSHGKGLSETTYPPCYFDPCLNGAECMETSDTEYTCNCTAGYTGPVCGELIDMCEPNPCNDTSRCFSVEGVSYLCKPCPRGYHGFDCQEKAFCDLLTPCTHGDLVGNCTETEEKYFCECGDGKQRKDCDLSDTCAQVECLNNATCVEENDEFECQCNEAFEGRYCEIPVDNCAEDTCQNGGTCVSLFDERKYFCLCAFGYTGDNCEIALDMCENEPCQNGGNCSTVGGMFVCECPEPYFGHDCSNSPCDAMNCNDGQCELVDGSPVCSCNTGYTGDNCGQDVNECLDENACTKGQGRCTNSFGDYQCDCYPGFEGKDCEVNIDDCTDDSCNGNGFCMDGYDTFTCLCDALYTGEFCEEKSNMCSPDPCQNEATCYNYGVDYFCICPQGWEGVNCSVNSDDCSFNRCENGARCVDELNSYSCDCDGRYTGRFCERDVDECANNSPCLNGANCTNTIGGFECECPEFFAGDLCEVSLGECHGNPCQNGGECYELGVVGEGRECRCLEGWTGENCEIRVTECDINPCQNGGTCSVSEQGYVCQCKYPYSGPACNTKIIVPHLASAESYVSFETSIVDISAGFEFRFLPERSGFVFHLVYSNFFLNALYTENNDLVFTANLDGRVHFSTAENLSHAEWNKVHIKANGKSITITVNDNSDVMSLKTTQLKSILRKRHQFYIGDSARKNSFVGCFYDLGKDLGSNGVESHNVEYCDEGNTCVAGHLGPCGEGGLCNELGHCDCPLGRHGKYCEADRASRNPSFNRDGYMLLEKTDVDSYTLSLAAQGTGAVFVGYDKKNREMVSLVIDSTSIKLAGSSQETIYIKGYDGAWMDLTILLDISEAAVYVQLGTGEEMMVFFQGTKKLSKLYLGGSATFSNNFRGCFTELQVNGKEPQFEEQVNVRECAMEGCYEDACQNSVNNYNKCVSSGPRYFSCVCGHNYVGEKCDVLWNRQTPRFNGNSFLKFFNPDNSTSGDLMLSIVFKVTGKSGLLFITEPSEMHTDYIEIGISRGRLYLTYELGAGPAYLKCPRRVDDGKWHFLHMTLRGKHAILMVDRWASEVVSPGQRNVLNVGPYLYLGGSPNHPGITGCVESLSVRDEPMTMSDTIASSNIDYCEDNVPENSIYKLKYRLK